jgi:tetratricopeptide (TPR) repeat protein
MLGSSPVNLAYLARVLLPVVLMFSADSALAQGTPQASRQDSDASQAQLLQQGIQRLRAGDAQAAIAEYFDKVIAYYDSQFKDGDKTVYGARTQAESLLYLLTAAKDNRSTIVVKPVWGDAMYAKAYALIELKRGDEAQSLLQRAVSISPSNAQYLGELGHIHQLRKEWQKALVTFNAAEEAANGYSPPEAKLRELSHALRGSGYVLVELQRLDEAEAKYRRCLELDSRDTAAARELQYIQQVRAKAGSK